MLNEFVFIKSLDGSNYSLAMLFQFSMVVFILLVFVNEFIKRSSRKMKILRYVGLISRLPLFLFLFFPHDISANNEFFHLVFLLIFLVYYLGNIIIFPMINLLLKRNYSHANFGKYYSYSSSINKVFTLVTTFGYGLVLDFDFFAFTYIYPVIAGLGIISVFILSAIPFHETTGLRIKMAMWPSIWKSITNMIGIVRYNKAYRHFEISFMFYGVAFMLTYSIIILFLEKELLLSYSSVAFYRNLHVTIAIVLLPFMGRVIGKIDPRRFASLTYLFLLLHFFFFMITPYFPVHFKLFGIDVYIMLVISFVFTGLFTSTMAILWNIGSAYFCKPEEAGEYQAAHLSFTGIRAIFAPFLGMYIFELFGYTVTFSIAIFMLLTAILIMFWSYRKSDME